MTFWGSVIYHIALFAGIFFIVETRLRKSLKDNDTVIATYLSLRDEQLRNLLLTLSHDLDAVVEELEKDKKREEQ